MIINGLVSIPKEYLISPDPNYLLSYLISPDPNYLLSYLISLDPNYLLSYNFFSPLISLCN